MSDETTIAQYEKIRDDWQRYYKFWFYAHYALGIAALTFATLTASKQMADLLGPYQGLVAWLAALCTGLVTFISADDRGKRYNRAWILLSSTLARYHTDHHTNPDDVIAAHELGERIIHNVATTHDVLPKPRPPRR